MRCTRCDGLAVPQAVGIAPDGRVVFGWCRECLADTDCRLVEVPGAGLSHLRLNFRPDDPDPREPATASAVDQSAWALLAVAVLLIGWGLVLMAAGLFVSPRATGQNPLGNGTAPLLGVGGAATAIVGMILLVLATARQGYPASMVLRVLGRLTFLAAAGILAYGIFDYEPRRNVPLVLATSLAVAISILAHAMERSQRREALSAPSAGPRKPATAGNGLSNARSPKNLN
jgi:hypothetical protein